ncbi:hypothetical protein C8J56DRAFT_960693 [Mycena floridula]|nr:hypothetical protein C8J56DRAFT_960693 [Mycena floridula]
MSHHPQYIHYTGPSGSLPVPQPLAVAPQDTLVQPNVPIVAAGDWTKDLVHLAKTAELKKHALTLQLHTAHIMSAHASLEQKGKAIQDLREQKNKLDSERNKMLDSLRQINEDRDKADMMITTMENECSQLRRTVQDVQEGEYAAAKRDVDKLRRELGQPALPSLQNTLDEKNTQYLTDRRLNGSDAGPAKRGAPSEGKRPRGRPRGSKNRKVEE